MLINDPLDYFGQCTLDESLILRFCYRADRNILDIVFKYAADNVAQAFNLTLHGLPLPNAEQVQTDFRLLRFTEVRSLIINGDMPAKDKDWSAYESVVIGKPRVFTGVIHGREDFGYVFSFHLTNLGYHRLLYSQLNVESRLAIAHPGDRGGWDYQDARTGERVNCYNPFPAIDE